MIAASAKVPTTSMEEIWSEALRTVEDSGRGGNLDIWLSKARLLSIEGGSVRIEVLNEFCRDWIREHYLPQLCASLARQLGRPIEVTLEIAEGAAPVSPEPELPVLPPGPVPAGATPYPQYTFERLVVGPFNDLAYRAARSVAESARESTEPVFIYAPSGLGKTHLLWAIANAIATRQPRRRVRCLSTQRLVEEFVRAVRSGTLEAFDHKYREDCEVLLLDDVHVLAGKDGTQERFFHIYNALHERGVPMVVTSDRRPREIPDLEERLRTRFLGGLVVDIEPPDFETRIAILRQKAREKGLTVPGDVVDLLARRPTYSIRELEGILSRLAAEARAASRSPDSTLAQHVLDTLTPQSDASCTIDDIQRAVCSTFGIHLSALRGRSRRHSITLPRHIAMFLARDGLRLPLETIGEHFGNRDHTTVLAACRRIAALLECDASTRNIILALRRKLGLP